MSLNNRGSIIYIIFLLILLAFIGAMIVSLLSTTSVSSSEELLSIKAFYLAESGVEIGIKECLKNNNCSGSNVYEIENSKGKINITFNSSSNITLDNGADAILYNVSAIGQIDNIKRKIKFKFRKE